jgi:hypothetical protein
MSACGVKMSFGVWGRIGQDVPSCSSSLRHPLNPLHVVPIRVSLSNISLSLSPIDLRGPLMFHKTCSPIPGEIWRGALSNEEPMLSETDVGVLQQNGLVSRLRYHTRPQVMIVYLTISTDMHQQTVALRRRIASHHQPSYVCPSSPSSLGLIFAIATSLRL